MCVPCKFAQDNNKETPVSHSRKQENHKVGGKDQYSPNTHTRQTEDKGTKY